MITFLFWNLNRKPIQSRLAGLVAKYEVNVVVLAESRTNSYRQIEDALTKRSGRQYKSPFSQCEKIAIFTDFPETFLWPELETPRLTIRSLRLPGLDEILVAATHFPSKLHWSRESQFAECIELATSIRVVEKKAGHSRTVLIGDLNMNPFEDGVVAASGLHGVMTRRIADNRTRIVQDKVFPFFYNPMWGRFGDTTEGPPGTYYDHRSEQVAFFWNMFDQVLIRPDLMPYFHDEDLKVLAEDDVGPLLSEAELPDNKLASDHLPIVFKLRL